MGRIFFIAVAMFGAMLLASQSSWAYYGEEIPEEVEEIPDNINTTDTTWADDWFTKDREDWEDGTSSRRTQEGKKRERYLMLCQDDSFIYWLDTQNVRWIDMPYSSLESIIDIWVRLEDISEDAEYSYPQKYYMEHFYLRPERQQIQFLSELEVTGKPQNAIKERQYRYENWENLVPGSTEEEIYYAVVEHMKELEKSGAVKKRKSDYDFWDDTLRIGGIF